MNIREAMKKASGARQRRSGFSLIEMLVVMGIIAFLTAAIVVVLPRVQNTAKVAATRSTIKKVDELLNDRINGFRRWINKQDQIAGTGIPSYVISQGTMSQANGNIGVAKILAIKQLFLSTFPQRFSEMSTPPTFNTANHNPRTESAACLYLILTQAAIFDTEPPSAGDLKSSELVDTDGDGLLEVVDGYGQPLRFYRWPTRLTRPNYVAGGTTSTGFVEAPIPTPLTLMMGTVAPRNPLFSWTASTGYSAGATIVPKTPSQVAPFSLIYQCVGAGTTSGSEPMWPVVVGTSFLDGGVTWQAVLDPLSVDPDDPLGIAALVAPIAEPFETPNTWSNPLIVSCGVDGLLGLYEPTDTANLGNLAKPLLDATDPTGFQRSAMYDNISNHQ